MRHDAHEEAEHILRQLEAADLASFCPLLSRPLRALLIRRQQEVLSTRPEARGLGFSIAMIEHADAHRQLYPAIVDRESGARVLRRIHRILEELVEVELRALGFHGSPEQCSLAVQYVTGAFIAVLHWWLDQESPLPPSEVDGLVRRLVMDGLAGDRKSPFHAV